MKITKDNKNNTSVSKNTSALLKKENLVVNNNSTILILNNRVEIAAYAFKFIGLVGISFLLLIFNVLSSYYGFVSYNNLDNSSKEFELFSLLVSIVMIIVPSMVFMFFYSKLREVSKGLLSLGNPEKVIAVILIFVGVTAQLFSTFMTYETLFYKKFSNYIENEIAKNKEYVKKRKEFLAKYETSILESIKELDSRINENNKRIKLANDEHIKLDYTFKTNKENLLKEIERADADNARLKLEKSYKLKELENNKSEVVSFDLKNLRLGGLYVLGGTSTVIPSDDIHNIIFCWCLFLLSLMLDIFLSVSFCVLRNTIGEFLLYYRSNYNGKCGKNKESLTSSFKTKPTIKDFNDIPTEVYNAVKVISKNLEKDNKTIKSINTIHNSTKMSIHEIRKMLQLLFDYGFSYKGQKRFILNVDATLAYIKNFDGNRIDQTLRSEFRKAFSNLAD
ncbi:hypothetical protein F0310_04470 (plasmid) [Borrelia sp. A-FGy1]|uniref:DUF4200 domain-containing protein n=1 Tax=Borrelia sp. A-FGy1 TaxID=2608247 RepID=UPI0015F3BFF5|nr:DUF4200 domain-containing protein [Borrelia sp. A-FGy1]QMU99672.1 hypothetical protein F0310_04470 [Borrelia sp. A-FGy1]